MKCLLASVVCLTFGLIACGEEPEPDVEPACIDVLASCEFAAARESGSQLSWWLHVRDCSWDYGKCTGMNMPNITLEDCEEACGITHVPSGCAWGCEYFVATSSIGG